MNHPNANTLTTPKSGPRAAFSRRAALAGGIGAALAVTFPLTASATSTAYAAAPRTDDAARQLRALERRFNARLGVFGYDTGSGSRVAYRADELFPMCSTSKTPAVGAVLRDLDRDGTYLSKVIRYGQADVDRSGYAPITGLPENLAQGMTVSDLCGAAISYSDNTAMNLLLGELGGPTAVTRFCRSLGDTVTRLDRYEPELNSAEPGRTTDTSSPSALGTTYARLALGRALDPAHRRLMNGWLLGNTTGDKRIRAGVPQDWTVGDKTGTGRHGTTNDAGIAWPPGRSPIVLSVLSTQPDEAAGPLDALVAEAASVVATTLG
ncbi:class A beta-lactamase [Streptomyces sp. NPDC091292]|uniref:class A beta-lactamase n=1 Tax=Streptomyces sp. NPDC091292 TaxID=3365991 RepID=UPI00380CCE17